MNLRRASAEWRQDHTLTPEPREEECPELASRGGAEERGGQSGGDQALSHQLPPPGLMRAIQTFIPTSVSKGEQSESTGKRGKEEENSEFLI